MADAYGASRGDRLSTEFWDLLAAGQFVVQRCHQCQEARFPPTTFCPRCHGIDWSWVAVSGAGTLWSTTTVRVAPSPDLQADVPYHLAVVELAEGPRVLGRLRDAGDGPAIGLAVVLVIDPPAAPEQPARYHFRPSA